MMLALVLALAQSETLLEAEEKRIQKFKKTLETRRDDPDACLQVGRFLCLTKGDWDAGLPLLAKGKDKAWAELAQYELDPAVLPADLKIPLTGATADFGDLVAPDLVRGDALWDMLKKYKDLELRNIMNRAIWRYRMALSKVDEARKKKLLDRIFKVTDRFKALYTHPGKVFEGPPKGWGVVIGKGEKIEGVATDESRSRMGRASMRVSPARSGLLVTEQKVIQPGEYLLSFWYQAEGTTVPDLFHVLLMEKDGNCTHVKASMPPDKGELPNWIHVTMKVKTGPEIFYFRLYVDHAGMRDGSLWIDDVSFKSPKGEELVLNGGFEDR